LGELSEGFKQYKLVIKITGTLNQQETAETMTRSRPTKAQNVIECNLKDINIF
jgi:hypothetical protein